MQIYYGKVNIFFLIQKMVDFTRSPNPFCKFYQSLQTA